MSDFSFAYVIFLVDEMILNRKRESFSSCVWEIFSHFIRDENEFLRIYHRMIAHSMGINQNYMSSSSALSYEHWVEGGKTAFVDFNCSFCCKLSGNKYNHKLKLIELKFSPVDAMSLAFTSLRGWDSIEVVRMMAKSRRTTSTMTEERRKKKQKMARGRI